MNISSVTNALPQPPTTAATSNRAEDRVEGTARDNDGDKDDTVRPVPLTTNTTGTVGAQINITV